MQMQEYEMEITRISVLAPEEKEYRLHISDQLDEARHEMFRYQTQFDKAKTGITLGT